ncbi:MAG: type III-A CRISPR-associated protein Csm2, partial [Tissierellia bacterium]|nr:type III-A CRISPR-associated protein Csm2 [Tissierellia bacterium]
AKRGKGNLREEELADIQILRMKLIYDSGREKAVKEFVHETKLLEYVSEIGNDRNNLIVFCRYMEALVAYHKYWGGK